MAAKAIVLENISFEIDPTRVLREMRISRIERIDQIEEKPLAESIRKAIETAYTLIQGKGVYRTYGLSGAGENIVAGDGLGDVFSGSNMVKLLSGCPYASGLACTIGPGLEARVEQLQKAGELTDAYSLEMEGGWMADYFADRVDDRIQAEIRKLGYASTMRYSPGYGDWPLEKQPDVLRLAEAHRVGIELTGANIMIPRKSVSAVIGWKLSE